MNAPRPSPDSWAREAAGAPIAFSQVREDPLLDEAVLADFRAEARVFMIASGGDTVAALLATEKVSYLRMVDFNAAQLALARVKMHLLRRATPEERLAVLGHLPMEHSERARILAAILEEEGLPAEIFGPAGIVAARGLDHAGRYEILFHHLRAQLRGQRPSLMDLLTLAEPIEQARRVAPGTDLGDALDEAFDTVMRLDNLVCLFGEEATRNARLPFSRHFADRTRHAFATLPARTNPFLAQLLLGEFVHGVTYDWLTRRPPSQWPEVTWAHASAIEALAAAEPDSFDVVHLSNILDWLSPEAAAHTLALAWRALRSGGCVVIRQLNSSIEIPAGEPRFVWRKEASALHEKDRSFFYRAFFIGMKGRAA